jgi:hypothetical protein
VQDFTQAFAFIAALTNSDPNTAVIDLRAIHDTNKTVAAIPRRGTLPQLWEEMINWNNGGYGIFININEMDGSGRYEIANVQTIRCQAIDLDNLSAPINYERAIGFNPFPSFAVQSSPGKYHVYWTTRRHNNLNGFTLIQRKLRTLFDGDKTIIDPSRVLRLPGFFHLKQQPHLVRCWQLGGYGNLVDPTYLETALYGVNVVDGNGERHELGAPSLQAPGYDWCIAALNELDPNEMDRGDWISFMAAWKQAAWNFAPEDQLQNTFMQWCARYRANNPAENLKNWNSIRNTEAGWLAIERRSGNLQALRLFGNRQLEFQQQLEAQRNAPRPQPLSSGVPATSTPPSNGAPPQIPMPTSEMLTDQEQEDYFDGCVFIERMGLILTPNGRFMNQTQFNGTYGGKQFIIDGRGKVTNEPWQAATRSTLWTVPKVDHIRFVPSRATGEIITDALGRTGVNTYKPAIIDAKPGDITPFMQHMQSLFPSEIDQRILFDYLAHNVKYPGHKIPWAPLIQSTEGAGKNVIKSAMKAAIGGVYTYEPKAKELIESGSKFNAWMRSKLFILVDEIKTDERRDMIEVLKPMISEIQIEVQGKGVDQDLEDNYSNWLFFSNYKDAIPVSKNSRRFAILYSAIQSKDDLDARRMDQRYFDGLYGWLNSGGASHVAHWLLNYPIERGAVPMRAPLTTSTYEAVRQSRGPVETLILDAIEDSLQGFRGGWVSTLAVMNRVKVLAARPIAAKTLATILEALGYHAIGRATRPYMAENKDVRADLFHWDRNARVEDFGRAQGYDV